MSLEVLTFLKDNLINILIGAFVLGMTIFALFNSEKFVRKMREEAISFLAMIFSISLAIANVIFQPAPLKIATASIVDGQVLQYFLPFSLIVIVVVAITGTIFLVSKDDNGGKKRR